MTTRKVADSIDTPGYSEPGWEAATWDDGDHVHVIPLGDALAHDEDPDGDCLCGPTIERVERDDGSDGWLLVHHALDGRSD